MCAYRCASAFCATSRIRFADAAIARAHETAARTQRRPTKDESSNVPSWGNTGDRGGDVAVARGSGSCGGGDFAWLSSGRRQPRWCDSEAKSDAVVLSAPEAGGFPAAAEAAATETDEAAAAAMCGAADRRALPTSSTCSSRHTCKERDKKANLLNIENSRRCSGEDAYIVNLFYLDGVLEHSARKRRHGRSRA